MIRTFVPIALVLLAGAAPARAANFLDITSRYTKTHVHGTWTWMESFRMPSSSDREYDSDEGYVPPELLALNWRYGISAGLSREKIGSFQTATPAYLNPVAAKPVRLTGPSRFGFSVGWTSGKRLDVSGGVSTYYVKAPKIKANSAELWITHAFSGVLSPPIDKARLIPMRYRGRDGDTVVEQWKAPDDLIPPARHLVIGPSLLTSFESPESAWLPLNWTSRAKAFRYGFAGTGRHLSLTENPAKGLPTGNLTETIDQWVHRLEFLSVIPDQRVFVMGLAWYFYNSNVADTDNGLVSRGIYDSELAVLRTNLLALPRWIADLSLTLRPSNGGAFLLQGRAFSRQVDNELGYGFLAEYRFPLGKRFWLGLHGIGLMGALEEMGGGMTISVAR